MKINYLPVLLPLAIVMLILSAGCATKLPMVSAVSYSQFTPVPTNAIALSTKANPNPEDEELNRVLIAELNRQGFNLVPYEKADYILTYAIEDEWMEDREQSIIARPMPPAQTTAQMDWGTGTQTPGISPVSVTTTFTSQSKGIRLIVYTNPKRHPGGLEIVWQGCIDSTQTLSSENETALIRTLLGYFGQNHEGRVALPLKTP
jgi:hypothetical protein